MVCWPESDCTLWPDAGTSTPGPGQPLQRIRVPFLTSGIVADDPITVMERGSTPEAETLIAPLTSRVFSTDAQPPATRTSSARAASGFSGPPIRHGALTSSLRIAGA
jgi:hypothetical protein